VLFKLERDDCPMSILYEAMDCAKEEILRYVGDKHGDILSWVDKIWDIYLHSPLHAAGYMLNPRVFYKDHACDDPEVVSGIEACITRMANGNYDPKKVKAQTEVYRRKLGSLGSDSSAIKEMMELPQGKVEPILLWSGETKFPLISFHFDFQNTNGSIAIIVTSFILK
jgi:hypothetical protein